jgi:hypothetical protein
MIVVKWGNVRYPISHDLSLVHEISIINPIKFGNPGFHGWGSLLLGNTMRGFAKV